MSEITQTRRLLLVTYWYPPAVGAAAERMHSFARHLPEHAWDVRVLTAKHGSSAMTDAQVRAVADPWQRTGGSIADYSPLERPGWSARLRAVLRELVFPDRFVRWQEAAFHEGLQLIGEWRPDLILASFPPASAIQLAVRLHKATGVPLVVDYRDKWLGPGGYEPRLKRTIQKHVFLQYEGLMASAGVTAVSEALIADLVNDAKYPAEKTAIVYNGFEPSPTPARAPQEHGPDDKPVIAHVGTVIARNQPGLFFQSVNKLMAAILEGDSNADALRSFRFRFVGNLDRQFLTDTGIDVLFTSTGLVSRESARAEMFNADALLLLTGHYVGKWGYSVKLFEYLQTGRPVVCLEESPGSNDARLLRELIPERCFIGKLGEPASLAEQLLHLREFLEREKSSDRPTLAPGLVRFSRAYQAATLAGFLHRIAQR